MQEPKGSSWVARGWSWIRRRLPVCALRGALYARSQSSWGTAAALSTKPLRIASQPVLQNQPISDDSDVSTKQMFCGRHVDEAARRRFCLHTNVAERLCIVLLMRVVQN